MRYAVDDVDAGLVRMAALTGEHKYSDYVEVARPEAQEPVKDAAATPAVV